MKITVQRTPFMNAFQMAAIVAPSRSPKPILQNVKIEARDDVVRLSATDTEVGIVVDVDDVDVNVPGTAVISVTRLNSILRETSVDTLDIEADEGKATVTGTGTRFELQCQDPVEFPEVRHFDGEDYYEIPAHTLRECIHRTLFATDAESSRYALSGVLIEFEDDKMLAVGTDGRRLAKMEGKANKHGNPQNGGTTIVPSKSMSLLERVLPDDDETVKLAVRNNDLVVKRDGLSFNTRLVEGRFPKWREVIPNRSDAKLIELPVGPVFSKIRQAAIVSSEESRGIDFKFGEGSLILSSRTAEVGNSRIEMPVAYDEEEVIISLDGRYVADFLKVLKPEDTFTLDLVDDNAAAYCKTADNYGYVIMPMARDKAKKANA